MQMAERNILHTTDFELTGKRNTLCPPRSPAGSFRPPRAAAGAGAVPLRGQTKGSKIGGKMRVKRRAFLPNGTRSQEPSPDAEIHQKLACSDGGESPENLSRAILTLAGDCLGTLVSRDVPVLERACSRGPELHCLREPIAPLGTR